MGVRNSSKKVTQRLFAWIFLDDATIRKRVQLGIRMMYQQTCTQTRRASVDGWTELDLWQVQQQVSVIR